MNTAQSASYPSVANYPAYAPEPSYREDVAPLRRTPRFIYYIVGTVAIGIALGIVLALRGGTSNPPLKPPAVAEGSAEVPAVAAGSDVTAGSAVAPTGSAAVPSAGSAMAGSADAGSANGSDTGATNGSASVGSGATDGSALAGSGTTDGSAHVATPTGGSKPPKDPTKKHPPPPREAPDDVLAKQIAATKYTDAVATCVANATLQTASVNACVIAACHTHDAAHAKRWLAGAGAKKAALVSACKTLGTSLESAPPKPDCAADPMACQH